MLSRLSLRLEVQFQRQLHAALERSIGEFSESWVHLSEISRSVNLELGVGVYRGEVGVIEYVVDLGAELKLEALTGQRNLLEKRHIPVVDSRSPEKTPGTETRSSLLSTLKSALDWRSENKTIQSIR